jgi:transcriptional regulator with XRE-family HTH domain
MEEENILVTKEEAILETIGKFIFAERKKQNLTLSKLSTKTFGTNAYATRIGNIEKGTSKNVSVNTISLILKGLGYDMRELFKT